MSEDGTPPRRIDVWRLGRVGYAEGLALQDRFVEERGRGAIPDSLLLLEHPPVLTLGRGAKLENVIASEARLREEGVERFETDRGGDVTYHGPGQLVGYPIFDLKPDRQDVRRYVRNLEETQIRTLAAFGLAAGRVGRWPGVWIDAEGSSPRKIAALGVHLSRWLTRHGFALNVTTDLSHFGLIVPCGIREAGVTSIEAELTRVGRREEVPSMALVEETVAAAFAAVFDAELHWRGDLAPEGPPALG